MSVSEAFIFDSEGASLVGVIDRPAISQSTGLLIVTGGPQYRVGSHRLFTLLGRHVAEQDFACMRFDFRGSGDSDGERRDFEELTSDIAAAAAEFRRKVPEIKRVVLLGLCDGASAALISAPHVENVAGLILLNPWVHTEGSLERARLRAYYPAQLLSAAFWKRLFSGKVRVGQSIKGLGQDLHSRYNAQGEFLGEMLAAKSKFQGRTLVMLSQKDMTAQEFRDVLGSSTAWRKAFAGKQTQHVEVANANHTFSQASWRDTLYEQCADFLQSIER